MIIDQKHPLVFFVNGKKVLEENPDPEWTLLHYLRNILMLTGSKLGCGEGGCGACTVMVSKYDRKLGKVTHVAVNACLAPVCSMHGLAVTTVEGIGSTKTKLHPVQERIAKAHGTQCGFCTPGIVMSMYTLLRNSPKPSVEDLEITFQGNLCRCTGYRPIFDGFKTFADVCALGDGCCKLQNGCNKNEDLHTESSEFVPYDPTQELIFPPELKLDGTLDQQYLVFKGQDVTWFRPTKLNEILDLKSRYPDARIVVGNTEVGVEVKFKNCNYPERIHPVLIDEMTATTVEDTCVRIGASVTLEKVTAFLQEQIRLQPTYKTRIFGSMVKMLHWFAGRQIRNVASIAGNIMTASPISDLNQIFIAAKVQLELQSKSNGMRRVVMDETFFTKYRQNIVRKDEVLIAVYVPFTVEDQYFYAYKQARRRDDDTAIVNCAINVVFEPETNVVSSVKMAFGGMAPTTIVPRRTCQNLIGQPWDEETLNKSYKWLTEDLPLPPEAPGGMIQYRRSLTLSFMFKAYLSICQKLNQNVDEHKSALTEFCTEIPKGTQCYDILEANGKHQYVGIASEHSSAFRHATGEAVYCDDMPPFKNELHLVFVISDRAHAKFTIDPNDALKVKGVKLFISAKDIPKEKNYFDEPGSEVYFASEVVTAQGQVLGALVAEDQLTARKAAKMVKVTYEDLQPVIVGIEDAIKHNSFFEESYCIEDGDVNSAMKSAPFHLEGTISSGGQEHFYLETHCAVVVPKNEDGEMEIHCSTQQPMRISKAVGTMLNIPENRITTKVRRLGGAFGGKLYANNFVTVPVAIAAYKLGRPVRCTLDRDEDMVITGGRNPLLTKYKCGFDQDGKIIACDLSFYMNAGYACGISREVLKKCMVKFDNAYKIPNVRVVGRLCKTNIPPNTAFRAYGGPQGILAMENLVREVAERVKKDYVHVAPLNFYKDGDFTHYHQKIRNFTLQRCWSELIQFSNFHERQKLVDEFNRENRWKKRGISLCPLKHGIGLNSQHLCQGSAMVHVYTDGSVYLTHGGIEMGQGLHTKMIQIAAQVLQVSPTRIYVNESSTDKIPNASQTAASVTADLYGPAVKEACDIIIERLKPYKEAHPKSTWEEWVLKAYYDRVCLSATGFHKQDIDAYDIETNTGSPFLYFTIGTACSEVEIDCLTGDHQVKRTDIVMDVGNSLNPGIDVGQIEGSFMQGYGLYMLEEVMFTPDGLMLTKGPGTYKLPGFGNTPLEFNVSLLKEAPNPNIIYSSKGVGEPPLTLANSIYFATREAIKAARHHVNLDLKNVDLNAPLTSAKIRMACEDHLTSHFKNPKPGTYTPWNVPL